MSEDKAPEVNYQPPLGFDEVECATEFPPCINWETADTITGTVERMQDVKIRTKEGDKTTRLLVLNTDDGRMGVWESAGLSELFNMLTPGDAVVIHHVGEKKIPGKPSPMRTFRAFRKPGRK